MPLKTTQTPEHQAWRTLTTLFLGDVDRPAYELLPYTDDLCFEIRCLHGKGRPRKGYAPNQWFSLTGAGCAEAAHLAVEWGRRFDVYVGVLPRLGQGRDSESVPAARALWASVDNNGSGPDGAASLIKAAGIPPPHIAIASGGGIHAAWLLEETRDLTEVFARERVAAAVKRIALSINAAKQAHGGITELSNCTSAVYREASFNSVIQDAPKTDDANYRINEEAANREKIQFDNLVIERAAAEEHKHNLATLLRLPGSHNHKAEYGTPRRVKLLRCVPDAERRSLTWWRANLPPEPAPPVRQIHRSLQPRRENGKERFDAVPPAVASLIATAAPPKSRHDIAVKIAAMLFAREWSCEAVLVQLQSFADNSAWRTERRELEKITAHFETKAK